LGLVSFFVGEHIRQIFPEIRCAKPMLEDGQAINVYHRNIVAIAREQFCVAFDIYLFEVECFGAIRARDL